VGDRAPIAGQERCPPIEGAHEEVLSNRELGKRQEHRVQIHGARDEVLKVFWE